MTTTLHSLLIWLREPSGIFAYGLIATGTVFFLYLIAKVFDRMFNLTKHWEEHHRNRHHHN